MISIIVPVYNAEKYLRQCIDSVLQQTYKDWELLLINDGSKDSSLAICQEYSKNDSRIITIDKPNGGVSSARNKGLENTRGEWVTFLDSDDWLENEALEYYYYTTQRTNPDIVKVGYKCHTDNTIEEHSFKKQATITDKSILMENLQSSHYYGFVWNSLYKKELISNIKFDENTQWLEDQFFSYECFLRGAKVTILPNTIYNYRIQKTGSLSGVKDPFIIAYSADKDIDYKIKLFGVDDKANLDACWKTYHQWYTKSIDILYSGRFSYYQRKDFYKRYYPKDSRFVYPEEKQFYGGNLPFLYRDFSYIVRKVVRNILK